MNRIAMMLTLVGALTLTAELGAQGAERGDGVPKGYRPPAGMCRIWLDGVPAAQQPAPTDCASAVRNRPANGRVIFGDDPQPKKKEFKEKKFRGESRQPLLGRHGRGHGAKHEGKHGERDACDAQSCDARYSAARRTDRSLPVRIGGILDAGRGQ